ncbi:hypothetical protein Taro_053328, partial [Colocasia esculenta]|nr:hypothetical protein [Colocasia esculenta]
IKAIAKAYLKEAEWCNEGHIPTLQDHLQVSMISSGASLLICGFFLCMRDIATQDTFDWLASYPKIIEASAIIARLIDDVSTHEFEENRQHVASTVRYYMEEYDVSKEMARKKLREMVDTAWKSAKFPLPHFAPHRTLRRPPFSPFLQSPWTPFALETPTAPYAAHPFPCPAIALDDCLGDADRTLRRSRLRLHFSQVPAASRHLQRGRPPSSCRSGDGAASASTAAADASMSATYRHSAIMWMDGHQCEMFMSSSQ